MALVRLVSQNTEMYVDENRVSMYLARGYKMAGGEAMAEAGKAPEKSDASSLKAMSVAELRELAKARGIDGAEALRKAELVEILGE